MKLRFLSRIRPRAASGEEREAVHLNGAAAAADLEQRQFETYLAKLRRRYPC